MKNKINKKIKVDFSLVKTGTLKRGRVFNALQKAVAIFSMVAILFVWSGMNPLHQANAVGLDSVAIQLCTNTGCGSTDEATGASAVVDVQFEIAGLVSGNTVDIYLGEDTGGNNWGIASVTTSEVTCTDDGSTPSPSYAIDSINAATASLPMLLSATATTVGGSATTVTCQIGNGTTDPTNPSTADGYSIAVISTNDSGAGIAYVGDANDVTVSVDVLPNLALTISTADGTFCTTTSGVTSCDLGTVLTTTVNTGSYDVDLGTNAASGATVSLAEDGNLLNGGNDINDVSDGTVTAGSEEYGVVLTETGTAWTIDPTYAATEAPIISGPDVAATSSGPVDIGTDNIDVTHKVAVANSTLGLTYTHIVTWTATANF